jgi:thiamine transport system ATP-binding protein
VLHLDRLLLRQGDFRLSADLTIAPGDRVALMGPSGAGKSTLLSAFAGFVVPDQGRILWNGADLAALPPGQRPITMLFQDNNVFPHLTVAQNVGLGLRPDLRLAADQSAAVLRVLDQVGLTGLHDRRPAALSGGQIGRVALARALVRARPILALDEPFAALGPALKSEMLELVETVVKANDATLLMITHDPADARKLCGTTILVAEGTAQPPQPTQGLLDHPPPTLADYLGR